MKNKISGLILALIVSGLSLATAVFAGDRGPQKVTASLPLCVGTLTPPTGDTGRFVPQFIVFSAPAASTQAVSVVIGSITNTLGTKVIAAGDNILVVTNSPTLFTGDRIIISGTPVIGTNSASLIGNLWD